MLYFKNKKALKKDTSDFKKMKLTTLKISN